MSQAELPFAADEWGAFMAAPATWHEGLPDRSGLAQYTVALRSPWDPERLTRAEQRATGGGFEAWRKDLVGEPRSWAAAIIRLLRDGQSRTFNRIVLDLTARQYTADVALGKVPEVGLWLAVERGAIWWANLADGAVWFALRAPRAPRDQRTP